MRRCFYARQSDCSQDKRQQWSDVWRNWSDIYDSKVTAKKAKKKAEEYRESSMEDVLKADKNNYAIPDSDITKVELKKYVRGTKLNIKTSKKYGKTKWYAGGAWKDVGEKYENMLRPIFGDKLSVKKQNEYQAR